MTVQATLWTASAASLALAAGAAAAERRRARRRDIDRVGWMPWTGLQLLLFGLAIIGAALAMKA